MLCIKMFNKQIKKVTSDLPCYFDNYNYNYFLTAYVPPIRTFPQGNGVALGFIALSFLLNLVLQQVQLLDVPIAGRQQALLLHSQPCFPSPFIAMSHGSSSDVTWNPLRASRSWKSSQLTCTCSSSIKFDHAHTRAQGNLCDDAIAQIIRLRQF